MSNLLLNIRIFRWHFQIHRDRPFVSFGYNEYYRHRPLPSWFEVCR